MLLFLSLSASLLALSAVQSALGFVPAISNAITSRLNVTNSLRQSCPLSPHGVLAALEFHPGTRYSIFPPGFIPGRQRYSYDVPGTSVALSCGSFVYTPHQNSTQIDNVIKKVVAAYGSPYDQNHPIFNGHSFQYDFEDGSPGHGKMVLNFDLISEGWGLTYREAVAGVRGVDYIRHHWPQLDMCCGVMVREPGGWVDHGLVTLYTGNSFAVEV